LGHIVPGPPRPGNKHALMGTVMTWWQYRELTVVVMGKVAKYRSNLVLSFDYWTGADGNKLFAQIWDVEKHKNVYRGLKDVIPEQWAHANLRLSTFTLGDVAATKVAEEGDALSDLKIFGGQVGGKPLYIDNLKIREATPEELAAIDEGVDPYH